MAEVIVTEKGRTQIAVIKGYFDDRVGERLVEGVLPGLKAGKTRVVVDLGPCDLINSRGIAVLLDLCLRVKEDFMGRIILAGANELMQEVFKVSGVVPVAELAVKVDVAVEMITPPTERE